MKRIHLAVLAAAGLCVAVATTAKAQTRLNIGASVVNPMSDWGTADKMGFGANVGASFGLGTAPVHLRIEGSYEQTSHDESVSPAGNTKVMGGMLNLVYPFQAKGNIKPYIIGGLGYNNTKESVSGESKGAVGFGGGLGLNFALSSANLYLEGRYLTHKANDVNFTQLPITLGLSFPLGGK
jgi:opacity protein-like surface antigen